MPVEKWKETKLDEALIGLEISMCFVKDSSVSTKGRVTKVLDSKNSEDSMFQVAFDNSYLFHWSAVDVVGWYYHGQSSSSASSSSSTTLPEWITEKYARGKGATSYLFQAVEPSFSSLACLKNVVLPSNASTVFPAMADSHSAIQSTIETIGSMTDFSSNYTKTPFPLAVLFTLIVSCYELEQQQQQQQQQQPLSPSIALPVLVSKDKKEVYDMVNDFTGKISTAGSRQGHRELKALKIMVDDLQGLAEYGESDDNDWMEAYQYSEAIILTLSKLFESNYDSYTSNSDKEGITQVCADLIDGLHKVMVHPPSDEMEQLLQSERTHLYRYLTTGNYVPCLETEDFAEHFPDATQKWKELQALLSK